MHLANDTKILVTGGAGFLGKNIVKQLIRSGAMESNIFVPRSGNCDLRILSNCERVVSNQDLVIHCAGLVGGIEFNRRYPGRIFHDNATMGINLIDAAYKANVKKFVMIGSVCEYPKNSPIPFMEKDIWDGYPEETNAAYGLAKKMTLAHGQAYKQQYGFNVIHLLLANLYGPGDNFDPVLGHGMSAQIHRVYKAKNEGIPKIKTWGTGTNTREFVYVEDAAEGVVLATQHYNDIRPLNIGGHTEISMKELMALICKIMDYCGEIEWDTTMPDGQARRKISTNRARDEIGFVANTELQKGLKKTIEYYLEDIAKK